uniref:Tailspike n=1 Tax=Salmonella phage vB_SE130_2P TaxID=3236707 RepID=A0AB39C485_9VIRU
MLLWRVLTTPWVIKPWTDDNQWITDPAAIVATLKQSKTDGYQPTVNDYAKFPGINSLLLRKLKGKAYLLPWKFGNVQASRFTGRVVLWRVSCSVDAISVRW